MKKSINLKRGLDLPLAGAVVSSEVTEITPGRVAIVPDDFPGFTPKLSVKEGDSVAQGTPLLHDKFFGEYNLVSPVAGTVEAVVRGERRKIERVVVKVGDVAAEPVKYETEIVKDALTTSGMLALIRRRPYATVASPEDSVRDIFVTGFDSAPLAPSLEDFVSRENLEAGVKALASLTTGNVYLGLRPGSEFADLEGVVAVEVSGPHPAGNPGVQAANIAPVSKGDVVWTLDIATLDRIGQFIRTGVVPGETVVAVTGSNVRTPQLVKTLVGAEIVSLVDGNLEPSADGYLRIISGNVLTGVHVKDDGFLRYPYRQLTVIPEGNKANEFMGWASLSPKKMSFYRSFPGHFLRKLFRPDARLHGGHRAMIMSGEYDRVFPMDILPEYLIKAILSRNIERMEALGIYEVAPEDFALAEYIDPSKLELQRIVREGLDYMIKEA